MENRTLVPSPILRVIIIQPTLAKYRLPIFQELANRSGLDIKLVYGASKDLENVQPEGFNAEYSQMHFIPIGNQKVYFHGAQWKHVKRRYADVVVLNWTPRYITLLPALLKAKWNRVPVVLWGHGASKRDRWSYRFGRWLTGKLGNALLFYDQDTANLHIERGWKREKLFVAPNAIDSAPIEAAREKWASPAGRLDRFKQEAEIEKGPVILFVSRMARKNRLELLVEATSRLVADFPDIKTVIIGNGDKERLRFQQMAIKLGVEKQTIFLKGIYIEEDIAPWFLSADVSCYPENMGLSLLHAFWYGVPVVTSNCRECHGPEFSVLETGINGLAYKHGNLDSMVSSLKQLLGDGPMRQTMSEAARETVMKRYTVNNMVNGIESAIRYADGRYGNRKKPSPCQT